MSSHLKDDKAGMIYASFAFISWGILPIYWHYMEQIPSLQILAHRFVWSFVFVAIVITVRKQWHLIKEILSNKKTMLFVLAGSIFMSANWFIYIWSVTNDHVIEASLGYYINPLISIAFGMLFLKERLNKWQTTSLCLALISVIILTINYGQIPWISISLALTFALYGLFKKLVQVDAILSLALETIFLTPFAIAYLFFEESNGTGSLGHVSTTIIILLILSGILTAVPLLWFGIGQKRVSMFTMGFLQYIAPTINLILGVFFFHETFTSIEFISFSFIWLALIVFTFSHIKEMKIPSIKKEELIKKPS
ncbi:EamA family transporter RarD [Shimazuella sp. AN120528]|uniref:EamA family transporter RarD n=1 Tax=Shimazuella soli TaxID=1892854 RepID=UPI001F0FA1CF|nr:EamA family transporter RarD [Shimazuella soli]MCH5584787.1 EamA family transporter RarD [Shimazuella soli]